MDTTPRKSTLKEISTDLRSFDFTTFDPMKIEDKKVLMDTLNTVNAKLGKLLKGYS